MIIRLIRLRYCILAMVTLTSLFVPLSACSPDPAPVATTPAMLEAPIRIKVGVLPIAPYAVLEIAQAEGYFTQQGLDVELVPFRSGNEMIPLLLNGQLDVAPAALTAGFFNAIARGGNLKMALPSVTIAEQECVYIAYFIRKHDLETGIRTTPANWRGARIAMPPSGIQGMSGFVVARTLQPSGLDLTDVELVEIDQAAQPEALRSGQVDIVLALEPTKTRLAVDDDFELLLAAESFVPENLTSSVVAYGPRLLEDLELGHRFAVAYMQGVRQYRQGPTQRNVELIARFTGLQPDLVRQLCPAVMPVDGQFNVDSIMDYQDWLIAQGLLEQTVAPVDFLDMHFAEEALRQLDGTTP